MARAATTSDAFNAIAEPKRREIIGLLADGGTLMVGEIVERLKLAQPAVSKHLGVLREAATSRCTATANCPRCGSCNWPPCARTSGPRTGPWCFEGSSTRGDRLTFTTDGRSRKAAEVERYPWGEACWYFAKTREQFRIAGRLTLVRADHTDTALADARERAWRDLSDARAGLVHLAHPGGTARARGPPSRACPPTRPTPCPTSVSWSWNRGRSITWN